MKIVTIVSVLDRGNVSMHNTFADQEKSLSKFILRKYFRKHPSRSQATHKEATVCLTDYNNNMSRCVHSKTSVYHPQLVMESSTKNNII